VSRGLQYPCLFESVMLWKFIEDPRFQYEKPHYAMHSNWMCGKHKERHSEELGLSRFMADPKAGKPSQKTQLL
jgi:hypothetical protein